MKNMKKILAAGALLAMGTMAMSTPTGTGISSNADFGITLNVISPIEIKNVGGDIEFGQLTTDQIEAGGNVGIGRFEVTADDRNFFSFNVDSTFELENQDNDSIIGFYTVLKDNGTTITPESKHKTEGGLLDGTIEITLATPSTQQDITVGNYTGNVNIEVAYN